MEVTREKSLNEVGKTYLDMKNGKSRGFVVSVDEDKKICFTSFDMSAPEVMALMMALLSEMSDAMKEDEE